jgi:hypothetical protein
VLPFYSDEKNGAPKTAEARGTEVVLDALILDSYDARDGKLSDDARQALDNMWGLQLKSGDKKGAWTWLNFHNEPWEMMTRSSGARHSVRWRLEMPRRIIGPHLL